LFVFNILFAIYLFLKLIFSLCLNLVLYLLRQFIYIFVEIRNLLFDCKILPSYKPKIFTLVIGNIYLGGTGKSPMIKYLVRNLSKKYKIAVLSRGFGKKTKGLIEASSSSLVQEIGDEAKDLFNDFGAEIKIICSNSRKSGIKYIEENYKQINLIIMDDSFQHRWVKPHFSIILEAFESYLVAKKTFIRYRREPFYRQNRADLIIQTKLPDDVAETEKKFDFVTYQKYSFFNAQNKEIYFKEYHDLDARPKVAKISALADNDRFFFDLVYYFIIKPEANFSDHHHYRRKDVEEVLKFDRIITTTKDWVKIKELISTIEAKKFIIVKNQIDFKEKENEFLGILTSKIDNYYQNLAKKP
jgi:tetraacyldisaccharide 4'-kinase